MLPLITAHSGSDGRADNSLEFVRYALGCGAELFEVDIRRGGDGSLRLGHDAADESLPSLAEVFALMAETREIRINCDLKEPGLEEAVCALARDHGLGGRIVLTGTVDAERYVRSPALRETAELWMNLEEAVRDFKAGQLRDPAFRARAAEEVLAFCRRLGLDTVNSWWGVADEAVLARFREAGIRLSLWTVNEEAALRRFLEAGVLSVTTRRPALALALRAELSKRSF